MMRRLIRSTWAIPILIATVDVIGLVCALTGDGWRDAISWAALALPVVAVAWASCRGRTASFNGGTP